MQIFREAEWFENVLRKKLNSAVLRQALIFQIVQWCGMICRYFLKSMCMFVVVYICSEKKHLCVCIEKFVLGQEDRQFIVYSNFAGYCAGIGTKPFEML